MKVNVDKSWAMIELSDGTEVEIDERPYGGTTRGEGKFVNNFLFIKVKGVEIFKMFVNEAKEQP